MLVEQEKRRKLVLAKTTVRLWYPQRTVVKCVGVLVVICDALTALMCYASLQVNRCDHKSVLNS